LGPRAGLDTVAKRKTILSMHLPGIEPRSLVTILSYLCPYNL